MAMAEDLEMIMAEEMIIAEERGLVPCTSSGRKKDSNTGNGRGARGGKTGPSGGRGTGTRGTGRGGDPAPNKGQVVVGGRGRGRGRGGSTPALPRVVIKERCQQNGGNNGICEQPTIGKGKAPVIAKAKVPIPRFGGAETVAPRVTHRDGGDPLG
ncbi:hypothetical protein RHGRI_029802 [Rhododendron griersonianum]|uniref:Uncharacterized protein n=1 Tax=Rhododendron griersonianum TaxID=479676 RepID=A0AAV6IMW3_9ERIC|nr:hypothetical protein RHGRI_029802 [Rhododendron griersonianum]